MQQSSARSVISLAGLRIYPASVARPRVERDEPLENLSTRLPRTLVRRLRMQSAADEIAIQELVEQAVERELRRREQLRSRRTTKPK
jgi:hypothetical protein